MHLYLITLYFIIMFYHNSPLLVNITYLHHVIQHMALDKLDILYSTMVLITIFQHTSLHLALYKLYSIQSTSTDTPAITLYPPL